MNITFDDELLEVGCPTCGGTIMKTVGWFRQRGRECPHGCGTAFETEDFRRGVEDCERELERFKREF